MARLKLLLINASINFTENIFNTEDSIEGGSAQQLFVSSYMYMYCPENCLLRSNTFAMYVIPRYVTITCTHSISPHVSPLTHTLQDPEARIFIVASYAVHARRLLCNVIASTCMYIVYPWSTRDILDSSLLC